MSRIRLLAGTATAVLITAALVAHSVGPAHPQPVRLAGYLVAGEEASTVRTVTSPAPAAAAPFTITGKVVWPAGNTVRKFYPGATAKLLLTISNPSTTRSLTVTTLSATVQRAGPGCPGSNLVAGAWTRGPVVVPAAGRASTTLPLTMAADAPDACMNVTFPIVLTGRGS